MRLGWLFLWELGMVGLYRWGCRWRLRGVLEVRLVDFVGGVGVFFELCTFCFSEYFLFRGDF